MPTQAIFYGVPSNAPPLYPSPSGKVLQFPKSISRKALLRSGARIVGKSLLRAIPYAGVAFTLWEIYDALQISGPNPYFYDLIQDCGIPPFGYSVAWQGCGVQGAWARTNPTGPGNYIPDPQAPFINRPGVDVIPENPSFYAADYSQQWQRKATAPAEVVWPYYMPSPDPALPAAYPLPRINPNIKPQPMWNPDYWPDDFAFAPQPQIAPNPALEPFPEALPRPPQRPMPSPMWDVVYKPVPAPSIRPPNAPITPIDRSPKPAPSAPPLPGSFQPVVTTPVVPFPSRPPQGTKEKKFRSAYSPQSLLDVVSEASEIVDCLYSNLPSVAAAADNRALYADAMKDFWNNWKKINPKTKAQKAELLAKKPVWNKSWADPIKYTKIARKNSFADNTQNYGIDFADAKLKVIYDRFQELNAEAVQSAIQCAAINIAVDNVIGPMLGQMNPGSINRNVRSKL